MVCAVCLRVWLFFHPSPALPLPQDDRLAACLELLLRVRPGSQLLPCGTTSALASATQPLALALKLGLSFPRVAALALSALERWEAQDPGLLRVCCTACSYIMVLLWLFTV